MRRTLCACTLASLCAFAQEQVLIDFGATMRYLDNRADPGISAAWIQRTFDDASWKQGTYGVGYGAGALVKTAVATGTLSIYTRAVFSIADPAAVASMHLGADYDDAYVAWVNGVEVTRAYMPAGTPAWNTTPSGQNESSESAPPDFGALLDITAAAKPALVAGANVLAIGVWNINTGSSDLALAPYLSINRPPPSGNQVCGTLAGTTTWRAADSPYVMNCTVTIPAGAQLVIEPGVVVTAAAGADLEIHGALRAVGTAEQRIVFTRESTSRWGGIVIDLNGQASPAGSTLAFVDIVYAGTGIDAADTGSAAVVVEDVDIDYWGSVAVHWDDAPGLVLRRCNFGVKTPEPDAHHETINGYNGGALIEYCTFGRRYGYNDVIDLGSTDWGTDVCPVIRYNTFLGGDDDAIDFDGADGWIYGNYITNHWPVAGASASANGGGLSGSAGSRPICFNNIVYKCYHGIGYKDDCEPWLINNTVIDCHVGLTLYKESCGQDNSRAHVYNTIIRGCDRDGQGKLMTVVLNGSWWPAYCQDGTVCGTLDVHHSIFEGGYPGDDVRDADPLLADPANRDFAPLPGSPTIDAGFGGPFPITFLSAGELERILAEDYLRRLRFDIACVDDTGAGTITYADIGAVEFQDDSICGGVRFVRGDANDDGRRDISDAITTLRFLFAGRATDCADALDANDDGALNVADPVYLLTYLFAHGAELPPPVARAGADPTDDALGCERS